MGVRLLHLADLHLGSRHPHLGAKSEERAREVLDTFRSAILFALDPAHRIDAVLIAGNVFDRHRPDPEIWAFVRGLLGRLLAARKPVLAVPGIRDGIAYRDSVYRTERWPGVDLFTDPRPGAPVRHEFGGVPVWFYGMAACPGHSAPAFPGFSRIDEPGLHIGLLNAALPGHEEWEVRPHDQTIDPSTIEASGLDYLALGGFHGFTPLRCGTTTAAYAGTPEGWRFEPGDLGRKDLLVVDIDPETRTVTLEPHPVSARTLADWSIDLAAERINDPGTLEAALLARSGPDVIARVTLRGPMEFLCDLDQVATRAGERFHHLEIVDASDLLGSALLRRIEGENTIRGFFVRRLMKRIALLADRAATAAAEAPVHRDLAVARRALRLGLEQFIEEEPAPAAEAAPSLRPAPARVVPAAATPPPLPAAAASSHYGRNGDQKPAPAAARAKALLVSDRLERGSDAPGGREDEIEL